MPIHHCLTFFSSLNMLDLNSFSFHNLSVLPKKKGRYHFFGIQLKIAAKFLGFWLPQDSVCRLRIRGAQFWTSVLLWVNNRVFRPISLPYQSVLPILIDSFHMSYLWDFICMQPRAMLCHVMGDDLYSVLFSVISSTNTDQWCRAGNQLVSICFTKSIG